MAGQKDADPVAEPVEAPTPTVAEPVEAPAPKPRKHRRVRTGPVPGSDPHPLPEPRRHRDGENDEQLKRDVPPHWG